MKVKRTFLVALALLVALTGLVACEQESGSLSAASISKQSHEWVVAKKLTSTGPVDFDSTLNAGGAVTFDSTLAVTGASTLTGAVAANGGITVDSTAFVVADTSGNTTIAGTLDVTGMVTGKSKVINKTGVTIALTAADVQGTIITDLGDTGAITFTLPTAAAGYDVLFINVTGNDWIIDPADNADQIFELTNAAGDKITNTTAYNQVHLIALDASGYYVADRIGTWTDAD